MALPTVTDQFYPSPEEVLAQILNDLRFAYAQAGIVANVEEGSDHWIRAKAFAARVSIAIQNGRLALADVSPLTATDDALVTLAGIYGVVKRPAAKAAGAVIIVCTGSVTIPQGYLCTAPNGEKYETVSASTVSSGDPVDIIAVNAGESTNQDAGTILQWDSSAVGNLRATCTVDSGGIDGGEPEDDDERLRSRLILRLAFPGVGGNWSQIAQWAEESSASVEAAFVYPAVRGPASYDVAITKAGGDRQLSSTTTDLAQAYIEARMPGHADLNVTSVDPQEVDVIINMTLPLPAVAGGAGGGWRDASPWPSTADATLAKVTATGSGTITVNSTSSDPPVAGKRFGIWDPSTEEMSEFTVLSVSGSSGAYVVTIDPSSSDPMGFVVSGMYVSAGAVNLTDYGPEFLAQMQSLGPGEKTTSAAILPRGRRMPGPDVSNPYLLSNVLLGRLSAQHDEIIDVAYAARYETGTTTTRTSPSIPTTTADPPRILVLKHLAFRRQV